MNIPTSVIWFAIFIVLFLVYGLHVGHIHAIGFEAYVGELTRKYDLEPKEARKQARQSLIFSIVTTVGTGIGAVAAAGISIYNLINGY